LELRKNIDSWVIVKIELWQDGVSSRAMQAQLIKRDKI